MRAFAQVAEADDELAAQLVSPPGAEKTIFAAARQLSDLLSFPRWEAQPERAAAVRTASTPERA